MIRATTASRFAAAFLALAALVAMPFAQPARTADAAGPADIQVENGPYDVQGALVTIQPGVPTSNDPRWIHVLFSVHNYGGSSSGNVLVYQYRKYNNGDWVLQKAPYVIAPLSSGKSTAVWFDCYRSQTKGWPVAAKLIAIGTQEPAANRNSHNESVMTWPDLVLVG